MAVWIRVLLKLKYFIIFVYTFFWIKALVLNSSSVNYTMPDIFQKSDMLKGSHAIKDYCRLNWDDLQLQEIDVSWNFTMEHAELENPHVGLGGVWAPEECVSFQHVAIIIPYRNRLVHLIQLLRRLHPLLKRQHIEYQIFVLEQAGTTPFNRGMLMNIGVKESSKRGKFDCFIFHDVDLLPEHDLNIYMCDTNLRHLASAIDEMRYHVMFENYAGGVVALTESNFKKMNGYPNIYWGWGNEDDDFSARAKVTNLKLTRPPEHIGRYKMVKHMKAERSSHGYELFWGFRGRQFFDGINSLSSPESYIVLNTTRAPLYTMITVQLHMPEHLIPSTWPKTQETLLWFLKFYGWMFN